MIVDISEVTEEEWKLFLERIQVSAEASPDQWFKDEPYGMASLTMGAFDGE